MGVFHAEFETQFSASVGTSRSGGTPEELAHPGKDKYQDQVSDLKESWNDNTLTFSFSTYGFQVQAM